MCGIMMTSTICEDDEFEKMLKESAHESSRRIRVFESRTQAPDHPALLAADETTYLKFYILQVL